VSAALRLALEIDPPHAASLTLTGNATAPLEPGVAAPLDLTLGNPSKSAIVVTGLAVELHQLAALHATATRPCSAADFAVRQFSGSYPLTVPASSTRKLSELGIAPQNWPQITLLDLPHDQDGCQGATVTLSYAGTARTR
jgi:hypothetical protein